MSRMGQSLPKWDVRATSAFRLVATEERTSRNVSNVPTSRFMRSAEARFNAPSSDKQLPVTKTPSPC
jgi:hypothetical protein